MAQLPKAIKFSMLLTFAQAAVYVGFAILYVVYLVLILGSNSFTLAEKLRLTTGTAVAVVVALSIAAIFGVAGYGLLKLKPRSQRLALVLAAIGLLNVPIGTLLGAATLYFLLTHKNSSNF